MKYHADVKFQAGIILLSVLLLLSVNGCNKKTDQENPEIITLKYSSYTLPNDVPTVLVNHALDLVEEKTNGRVKIERYTGGSLGGVLEELDLVSSGSVDIIGLHVDQYPQDLPLHKILNSEQFVSREQALVNITAITREIPETSAILEAEQRQKNIKILYFNVMGAAGITTGFKARSLNGLKGKKMNVITSYQRKVHKELEIIPVNTQINELYESLSRGVIDAILMANVAVIPLKFYEVGKSHLTFYNNLVVSMPVTLNLNTWNSLPEDIQKAFLEASRETAQWSIEENKRIEEKTFEVFEQAGVDIVHLSKEESDRFWEVMSRHATEDWLENAKTKGLEDQADVIRKYWDEMRWGRWTGE